MSVRIFHNPRCSKSRGALDRLTGAGLEPEIVRYLETPPDVDELRRLRERLGVDVMTMVRTNERVWEELDLDGADDEAILAAVARHPILLQRPIVEVDDRAVIGRPPEAVDEILGGR